jgi:hypothetical protein
MAVTVLGSPTSPNVTGTKLVYSVSSSLATNPQYQYVVDIKESGSATLLTRLYAYPNEYGSGIIEVSRVLADRLNYDNDWKTTGGTLATDSFKSFTLHYSESYGTSISSSTTVYPGGATSDIEVFLGSVDPNAGSFNFTPNNTFQLLSDQPTGKISTGNYVTVPLYVPPFSVVGTKELRVEFVSASGDIISAIDTGALTGADYEITQYAIGSGSTLFNTAFETTDWDLMKVYDSGSSLLTTFKKETACFDEQTTFAFINNYGYYDYYTVGNPERKSTDLKRNSFDQPNVDYSSYTSYYDITRRGTDQYNIKFTDKYEITTDYISKTESDWLTQMLDSPEVFVQQNGDFIPIVITNANYRWNMSNNREKLFQYTIQYRYANQRYDR